ncbi:MAG: fused response regulator/phosphatase [Clostridia bacterium]|nr:fused response regulator/phosphatase [Clostridia bacterium]
MSYNILVVDDIFINRKLIKSVLKNNINDITFFDAEDGFKALEIISKIGIDLIILDLMLPGKDGYEVLSDLKSHETYKEIPVIVNSAVDELESLQRTFELGAMDYFTKPLTIEEMRVILPLKVKNALKYYEQKKLLVQINNQMKTELNIARLFQSSLMPSFKSFDIADMYGKYLPCKEVGGDLYDCVQIGHDLWFIIGDVTGHGVTSAMVSSMVKIMFNNCIQRFSSPSDVLSEINKTFCLMIGESTNVIFSAFLGVIRNNTLYYSNAGHPYPIVIDPHAGKLTELKQNGHLIGIFDSTTYQVEEMKLTINQCILTYTDGLFDTRSDAHLNIWDEVYEYSKKHATLLPNAPNAFLEALMNSFWNVGHKDFIDDITMMLIRLK